MKRKCGALEEELNKIGVKIYDEIKDMSEQERSDYFRKGMEEAAKICGCIIVESPTHKGMLRFIKPNSITKSS
jgi:hypothetical protein